ncbi:hypothetical protein [Mesorhizobium muleiense]|uniref:Uncharacterized protein n=1 Tax=Mesorhizobium muleiense TaxID=1004279 RepID=A0A1G8VQD2_9HYPH|nr:hypothetical protein [Mesorhizobium muleiense]MCF6098563.1 hypothetical protein [Mesorhizobium muleiense]SDJ68164.1 hypothetical protein SAMN05428953_10845 [Mesorhizobium muleiense]
MVSQSPREFQSLWTMRDSCVDYVRTRDHIVGGVEAVYRLVAESGGSIAAEHGAARTSEDDGYRYKVGAARRRPG